MNCVVIGDINIDYVVDLSGVTLSDITNACIQSDIVTSVGGNGTFFSDAAIEAGFNPVRLLCSLGNDAAAEIAKSHFKDTEIELFNAINSKETGKVIILYQPDDNRIMIANRGANEYSLELDMDSTQDVLSSADFLYVSGYALLHEAQCSALQGLLQDYTAKNTFKLLDAVPHEIFHKFSWEEYVCRCQHIDGIVIELATAVGFMGEDITSIDSDSIADFLLKSFNFCLVRLNSSSDFLIADRIERRTERLYYKPKIASLRFTDRITAQIIRRYLSNPRVFFASSKWVEEINKIIGGY
ncbi:MAG: carbohydrate kinase family protein [Peptococcaceae bacterium]|nr:carbohydrate kinase family protein [Peptococcaceae bacterium]